MTSVSSLCNTKASAEYSQCDDKGRAGIHSHLVSLKFLAGMFKHNNNNLFLYVLLCCCYKRVKK